MRFRPVSGASVTRNEKKLGPLPPYKPSVNSPKSFNNFNALDRPKKTRLGAPSLPPRLVPDERHPGMYRLRLPDGRLSDMVNLTRARDALAAIRDDGAP
jgi:hypothetical protein